MCSKLAKKAQKTKSLIFFGCLFEHIGKHPYVVSNMLLHSNIFLVNLKKYLVTEASDFKYKTLYSKVAVLIIIYLSKDLWCSHQRITLSFAGNTLKYTLFHFTRFAHLKPTCEYLETSQLICTANLMSGFYVRRKLTLNELKGHQVNPVTTMSISV